MTQPQVSPGIVRGDGGCWTGRCVAKLQWLLGQVQAARFCRNDLLKLKWVYRGMNEPCCKLKDICNVPFFF